MALPKERIRASALKHLEKGRLEKAAKEFERLVTEDPNDMRTMLRIGDLYERMGKIDDAAETYGAVATFYEAQGFLLKACAIHKQILKMRPDRVQTAITLATNYEHLGLKKDASREFLRVCRILQQDGQHRKRAEILEKLTIIEPLDVGTQLQFSTALQNLGYETRARQALKEAAEHHLKAERFEGYIELAERLLNLSSNDLDSPLKNQLDTRLALARVCLRENEAEKALANLETCLEIESNNRHVLALLAQTLMALQDDNRAKKVLWELFGQATVGEQVKAVESMGSEKNILEQILKLDPGDAAAQRELARLSQSGVNPAMLDPQKPQMSALEKIIQECDVYARYQRLEQALEHLDDALILSPNNRRILSRKRDWLLQIGKTEEAIQALWSMAKSAHQGGKREEALEDVRELLHHHPEHPGATEILATYGPLAHYEPTLESPAISLPPNLAGSLHNLSYEPSKAAESIDLDGADTGPLPPPAPLEGYQTLDEINISEPSDWLLESVSEDEIAGSCLSENFDIDLDFDIDADEEPSELGPVLAPPPPLTTPPVLQARSSGTATMPPPPVVAPPPVTPTTPPAAPLAPPPPAVAAPAVVGQDHPALSSEMEEIRFFLKHGLPAEAQDVLNTLLEKYPLHPGLRKLTSEHPILAPLLPAAAPITPREASPNPDEADLLLNDLLSPEGASVFDPLKTSELSPLLQATEFKSLHQHLPSELAETDFDTHYNLGIAYKEMGMVSDAIRELSLSAGSPAYKIASLTMLGQCQLEAGSAPEALATFFKALHSGNIHGDEQIALHYEIARAYLSMGVKTEAKSYFEKVDETAPGYRDVGTQLEALEKDPTEPTPKAGGTIFL